MKRAIIFFLAVVGAVAVLLILLVDATSDSNTLIVDEASLVTPAPLPATGDDGSPNGESDSLPLAHPAAPTSARGAELVRLADGDSFDIRWADSGQRDEVRLLGINAPEIGACFGQRARAALELLTEGMSLTVETVGRDEFGRALSNVWVEDTLVNLRLVELGAALALSSAGTYTDLMENAQRVANENQVGLWDPLFCGTDQLTLVRIKSIEEDAPGQDNLNPNGEWIEVANDGDVAVDLAGWSIRDESTRHRYFFPSGFLLGAGDTVRVLSGCGDDDGNELYWCDDDPVWNNGGDTGFLVDADGKFVDSMSYSG